MGCPRKTLWNDIKDDIKSFSLSCKDVLVQNKKYQLKTVQLCYGSLKMELSLFKTLCIVY